MMAIAAYSEESALTGMQATAYAASQPAGPTEATTFFDFHTGRDARNLFELSQLEVSWDSDAGALWTFMRPNGRPSYNLGLLNDFRAGQSAIMSAFAGCPERLRYLVLGSRTPGVFNLGGDLDYFLAKIRARDRQALVSYGESCVRVLHKKLNTLGLPMITIGLAQGDAFGGGFETLLSFNVIVAERTAKFGFPESLFGLFPGMGAYTLLSRRIGAAFAEEMMLNGRTYTADEMVDAGLVHIVAEPGQGIAAVRDYMEKHKRRHAGARGVYRAGREVNPVTLDELDRIVAIWADSCLELKERDLKIMQRLVHAQDKLQGTTMQAAE